MFVYEKKLQYPVNIKNTNPKLAALIISQYGGPDGELGASLRYLSQRYSMPYAELKGLLTDIGTEELEPWNYKWQRSREHKFTAPFCFSVWNLTTVLFGLQTESCSAQAEHREEYARPPYHSAAMG